MPGSIRSCPSCKTLVLQDTVQCPECGYVLDKSRFEQAGRDDDASQASQQESCSTCGENVQHGMVRCWNCGSFMQEEIAELFRQLQAKPAPILFSDQPDGEPIYSVEDPGDLVITGEQRSGATGDFELDGDFISDAPAESAGAVAVATQTGSALPSKPAETSETYALSGSQTVAEDEAATDDTPKSKSESDGADSSAGEANEPSASAGDDSDQSHSVATGGDVLLEIALAEERETGKRRRRAPKRQGKGRVITGFLVFCPNGHRIEVQDRHRGKAGRCPKCQATFIVPEQSFKEQQDAEQEKASAEATDQIAKDAGAGAYTRWMTDVHLHTVDPQKLRLKPGSLEKNFQQVDFGFCTDGLLIATLVSTRGLFGLGGQKPEDVREQMLDSLRNDTPVDDLPVAAKQLFDVSALQKLAIDQPVIYEHESMFVGVAVFGIGRIAVRFPKTEQNELPQFASFELSRFREFSKILEEMFGIEEFGILHEIPLSDTFTEQTCHYSEEKFRSLQQVEFYQADPNCKLKLVGRKCQGCGLIVSEDSRKKEKIGGSAGRGIARAKCPKCGEKFGDVSLFDLEEEQTPTPSPDEQAAESSDDADTSDATNTP